MGTSSLLQPGPIPPPFQDAAVPPFIVTRIEEKGADVWLHYTLEGGGPPISIRNKAEHETFPNRYEVTVGGWYGTMGQWSLLERYLGVVACVGVRRLRRVSPHGIHADFFIERSFWRRGLTLTVESEEVGLLQVRCKAVVPMPFQTLVFDRVRHLWVEKAF